VLSLRAELLGVLSLRAKLQSLRAELLGRLSLRAKLLSELNWRVELLDVVNSYVLSSWRGGLLRAGLLGGAVDSYKLNKILLVSLPVNVIGIPIPVGEKSSSHTIPLFNKKKRKKNCGSISISF
jgi:hypothetical protein